jgi:hypothetical protein
MASLYFDKLRMQVWHLAIVPLTAAAHLPATTKRLVHGWILYLHHLVTGFKYRDSLRGTQVRLLKLPGDLKSKVLRLGMEIHPVDECPPFVALSYTWNHPSNLNQPYSWLELEPIYIENRLFLVRPNLHHALKRLTQSRPGQYIWADAICINQSDAVEKPLQLRIMDLIYTKAQETVIWLGESTDQTDRAIAIVRKIATGAKSQILNWAKNQVYGNAFFPDDQDLLYSNALPKLSSDDWITMGDIFERSWFGRVWVIQELALSQQTTLFIGGYELPYHIVGDAALLLAMSNAATGLMSTETGSKKVHLAAGIILAFGLQIIREWSLGSSSDYQEVLQNTDFSAGLTSVSPNRSLVSLLSASTGFLSSKPLDKVYGLLGIINHISRTQGQDLINIHPPDRPNPGLWERMKEAFGRRLHLQYYLDKEAKEYTSLGTVIYSKTNSLNLLSLAGEGTRTLKLRIPSWIPSFSPSQSPLLRPNYTSIKPFNASAINSQKEGQIWPP